MAAIKCNINRENILKIPILKSFSCRQRNIRITLAAQITTEILKETLMYEIYLIKYSF